MSSKGLIKTFRVLLILHHFLLPEVLFLTQDVCTGCDRSRTCLVKCRPAHAFPRVTSELLSRTLCRLIVGVQVCDNYTCLKCQVQLQPCLKSCRILKYILKVKKISLAQDIQGCIFLSRNASDTGYLTMDTRNQRSKIVTQ